MDDFSKTEDNLKDKEGLSSETRVGELLGEDRKIGEDFFCEVDMKDIVSEEKNLQYDKDFLEIVKEIKVVDDIFMEDEIVKIEENVFKLDNIFKEEEIDKMEENVLKENILIKEEIEKIAENVFKTQDIFTEKSIERGEENINRLEDFEKVSKYEELVKF